MTDKKDLLADGSTFELSLVKLLGQGVKDVRGYVTREFGEYSFKLTNLVLEDGTTVGVEGEHDFPYLTTGRNGPEKLSPDHLKQLYD